MNNCYVEPMRKPFDREALDHAMVAYLPVQGLGCQNCINRVYNSLLRVDGVLVCTFDELTAVVAYDPQQITPSDLVEAVATAGNDSRHHYSAYIMSLSPLSTIVIGRQNTAKS